MASNLIRNSSVFLKKYIPHHITSINKAYPFRGVHLAAVLDKKVSFNLSDIGEGIREVVVKEWFVKVGDTVEQFENICEVQSDKASVTITSRYDGKIVKIYHKVDETVLVGKPLLDFDVEDEDGDDSSSSDSDSDSEVAKKIPVVAQTANCNETQILQRALATPAVRRIAMENKIDLAKVPATGRNGRVLKGDVLEFMGQIPPGTNKPYPTTEIPKQTVQCPGVSLPADRTETLKGVRKAMLKSMNESLKIPHFSYSDEIDMSNLIGFRDQLKEVAAQRGVPKLTFMPFCIKAASLSLTKYPILNSSLDLDTESVIYKGAHNISVAIDTPHGLVVPNIKNCQSKSIIQIARDLNDLVERGRSNSLRPENFMDGTFSLSNIGVIGGTYTHPCIMSPQVSIGAMGRTKVIPRFGTNGEIVKAHIMSVSWSADHRVIDGVTMAKFSNIWKNYIEHPALFLMSSEK